MENDIANKIKDGQIGVLKTDTIYGLVGSARNEHTVERIYNVKGRDESKPLIILINSLDDLNNFNIKLNDSKKIFLKKYWPGKVSIILPSTSHRFKYLMRGHDSLTFRMPKDSFLQKIISQTGPIVAPSANPQGLPPAENIQQAKQYFSDKIDFYVNGGEILDKNPSTLVDLTQSQPKILRQGTTTIV